MLARSGEEGELMSIHVIFIACFGVFGHLGAIPVSLSFAVFHQKLLQAIKTGYGTTLTVNRVVS